MSSLPPQPAKHYAKLICHYMKTLPDKYADDPQDVQDALGLSNVEFKLGLDWCVARKLITLEKTEKAAPAPSPASPAKPSPFVMDAEEDDTLSEREAVFGKEATAG